MSVTVQYVLIGHACGVHLVIRAIEYLTVDDPKNQAMRNARRPDRPMLCRVMWSQCSLASPSYAKLAVGFELRNLFVSNELRLRSPYR